MREVRSVTEQSAEGLYGDTLGNTSANDMTVFGGLKSRYPYEGNQQSGQQYSPALPRFLMFFCDSRISLLQGFPKYAACCLLCSPSMVLCWQLLVKLSGCLDLSGQCV